MAIRWGETEDSHNQGVRRWCVYVLRGGQWSVSIQGAEATSYRFEPQQESQARVRAVAVAGVDGSGRVGEAAFLSLETEGR